MNTIKDILTHLGESRYALLGVSAGISLVAVGLTYWYKKKYGVPSKWKKVGELSDLMCFPVKSCGVIRENEFDCDILGLRKGTLRDRRFMVIDLNGQFITGRQQPKLVKIAPIVDENLLTLTAPGMMDHVLDLDNLERKGTIKATVWGEKVPTVDCGEEVARWFSRFLLSEDTGLRLVYFPYTQTTRDVRKVNKVWPRMCKSDSGALHDTTHFNLICESSIVELNARIEEPVTPQHFRPNFVVKGTEAYEEDNWNYIKIGKTAVFQCVKPSIRYRQIYDPVLRPNVGECPVMGVNLGMRVPGVVKLGDPVYIEME